MQTIKDPHELVLWAGVTSSDSQCGASLAGSFPSC
jgi:hypothetical protein